MVVSSAAPRRANGTTPDTERYRAILTAAREVFRTQGYNETSVEDLRRAAGVSRATFYFYFQDKREVLLRLLSERAQQFHTLYTRRYATGDEYSKIVLANIQYFAHYSRDRDIFWLLRGAMDNETVRTLIEDVRRGFRQRVEHKIRRMVGEGEIAPVDPEQMAVLLIGMVESYARHFFEQHTTEAEIRAHLPEAVQLVSETWYRALYAAEPPRPFGYDELIAQSDLRLPDTIGEPTA
jgi:AcrR family transcriptional regulator